MKKKTAKEHGSTTAGEAVLLLDRGNIEIVVPSGWPVLALAIGGTACPL